MSTPNLDGVVVTVVPPEGNPSVRFPGGVELAAQMQKLQIPDPMEQTMSLLQQVNTALTPIVPVLNAIDAILAIKGVLDGIIDLVGGQPDKFNKAMEKVVELADVLKAMAPPAAIPFMLLDLIDVLLAFLRGLSMQLHRIIDQQISLAEQAIEAAEPGNAQLQIVVDASKRNLDAQFMSLSAGAQPLNRLIGIANLLCSMINVGPLPTLGNLGNDAQAALAPIDAAIAGLEAARSAIPIP